jgi:hypothetical protein
LVGFYENFPLVFVEKNTKAAPVQLVPFGQVNFLQIGQAPENPVWPDGQGSWLIPGICPD